MTLLTIMEMPAGSGYILGMDKHPKRPRDPSQLAKLMVDIATGEENEVDKKQAPAVKPKPRKRDNTEKR